MGVGNATLESLVDQVEAEYRQGSFSRIGELTATELQDFLEETAGFLPEDGTQGTLVTTILIVSRARSCVLCPD